MEFKKTFVLWLFFAIFIITGANWPDDFRYLSGADYERTRVLWFKEPAFVGSDVVELQERLKELGFYTGIVDGVYDREVERAVKSFQTDNQLAPDGVVKEHIWIRLADNYLPVSKSKKIEQPKGEVKIVIDTFRLRLIVLNDNEPYQVFPVAIGRSSTPTPIGNFQIVHKAVNWGTGFGTRWLGLNVPWGKYGIHGTNKPWSIGRMASHGCIRMHNSDVEQLYRWVKTDTEVIIIGNPFGRLAHNKKILVNGSRGADVMIVQEKLIRLGFLEGKADGIYGYGTERAVKHFQKVNKLRVTGQIGWAEYKLLNL